MAAPVFNQSKVNWLRYQYDLIGFSKLFNWNPTKWQLEKLKEFQDASRKPDSRVGVVIPDDEEGLSLIAVLAIWRARVWDFSSTVIATESISERANVMAHIITMLSTASHPLRKGFQLAKAGTYMTLDGNEHWSIVGCEPGLLETENAPKLREDHGPLTIIVPNANRLCKFRAEAIAPLAHMWVMLVRS